ncbi:MAG: oligosaccharide flippase family protein, partial [Prevotella sp.]
TQSIIYVMVVNLLRWHYSTWRPSWHIDFGPVKRMFPFSVKILGAGLADAINNNILNILLGHFFTKRDAGSYNQAYQWNSKCSYLVQGMVNSVAQPVFVDLNDNGPRQLNAMRKLVRFTAFIAFPLIFGLGLISREFIIITITEKWLFSAELLKLLCLGGWSYPIIWIFNNMIISKGRSSLNLLSTTLFGLCQIIIMVVIHSMGIRAMVIGYVSLNIIWTFFLFALTSRLTGYKLWDFLKDLLPFGLAAMGVMMVTGWLTRPIVSLVWLLVARIFIAAVLYYIVMRLAKAQILFECQDFVISRLRKHKE